jgi:hypothetical protein
MSENPRLVTPDTGPHASLQCVAVIVAIISFIPVAPTGTTEADGQQYSVVVRIDGRNTALTSSEISVRIGSIRVPATAIKTSSDVLRNIAIVVDAGPDQAKVLSREKELAVALVNELSDASTSFTIASASTLSNPQATTPDRSVAIEHICDIAGDNGEKTSVPIYDVIGSAIRQISLSPGLRVVIFIGEGNAECLRFAMIFCRHAYQSWQLSRFCRSMGKEMGKVNGRPMMRQQLTR